MYVPFDYCGFEIYFNHFKMNTAVKFFFNKKLKTVNNSCPACLKMATFKVRLLELQCFI